MIDETGHGDQLVDRSESVCVVGAGPHGLISARALLQNHVKFEVIERHSDVGGLWDAANAGTPLYASCHYISSRNSSAYPDYPMPDHFPDYPSHHHILSYIRGFATDFGLYPHIRFNTEVTGAVPIGDGRWDVTLAGGETRRYGGLICCPGSNWHPSMPELEGGFDGEIIHSRDYNDVSQFAAKRVLVIGLGNSGADIACDAAANAAKTLVSVRRGYHFIPKHIFGVPLLDFLHGMGQELVPEAMQGLSLPEMVKVVTGDPTRFGFPVPDHELLETHPLLNTQLLHYLAHGDAHIRGPVARLDGKQVHFADGSSEEIDLIVCATGYDHKIPFITEDVFKWKGGRPQLYMTVFHETHPTLFVLGLLEAGGAPYQQMDDLANFIAQYMRDRESNPDRAAKWEALVRTDQVNLKEGMNYVDTPRTANYVNVETFVREVGRLKDEMAWETAGPGDYAVLKTA
jgi:Flavin-binding monooxygenase-like